MHFSISADDDYIVTTRLARPSTLVKVIARITSPLFTKMKMEITSLPSMFILESRPMYEERPQRGI
ncbi:hypothetical protein I7I48_06267 [Histoplasma ohiense]|nr:hypothetical protein I7I48_06267 [Histoplasma ohiense (nom. inval.)]